MDSCKNLIGGGRNILFHCMNENHIRPETGGVCKFWFFFCFFVFCSSMPERRGSGWICILKSHMSQQFCKTRHTKGNGWNRDALLCVLTVRDVFSSLTLLLQHLERRQKQQMTAVQVKQTACVGSITGLDGMVIKRFDYMQPCDRAGSFAFEMRELSSWKYEQ